MRYVITKIGDRVFVDKKFWPFGTKRVSGEVYSDIYGVGDSSVDNLPIDFGTVERAYAYIQQTARLGSD